ncbi:DUF7683 domain-containing protein [Hyphococcus lacteus]|uniref:DUF7683 domain-containing protein n=1 Tax=Hyphococcus lacteus TaxID=3143536 RepID=A0ABV3Z7K7_9PROT
MIEYRIIKYDQSQRDERGAYIGPSAWTCYSDVGETFDGKVLTIEECLRVESAYINAAIKLFEESGLPHLRLTRVDGHEWQKEKLRSEGGPLYDPAFDEIEFAEDVIVLHKDMPTVLQMIFRGFAEASLEWRDKFYIHIGWDFHMYVGIGKATTDNDDAARSRDLYVESNYPSPYKAFNLPNNILHIGRNKIGEEFVDDSYEINLPAVYLERLKPIWGFSDEHPFLGTWRVNRHCKDQIEKVVGQDFDFEAYEYFIQTAGWQD